MVLKVAVSLLLATVLLSTVEGKTSKLSDSDQCHVGTLYKSSLPAGGSGVEHLKVLGVGVSAEDCVKSCCSLGPTRCQHLWVLDNVCIAVACENVKIGSCEPKAVDTSKISSVYVQMEYPKPLPDNLENALDWVDQVMNGDKDGEEDKGDSPPVAATRTDEIVVTLPTKEVYIYGNSSKDDKGIASYSWKLLSEHFVQPILENADKDILHVKNLIPGTYRFSLTVTDTSGQSGRTTVLVRVEKGSGSSSAAATTTLPSKSAETDLPTHPPTTPQTTTTLDTMTEANSTDAVEEQNFYTKRRNVLKIVIPVLLSVAVLLVVTAAITTACACCCERNRHRMKRYYKYKKLPETIEKT